MGLKVRRRIRIAFEDANPAFLDDPQEPVDRLAAQNIEKVCDPPFDATPSYATLDRKDDYSRRCFRRIMQHFSEVAVERNKNALLLANLGIDHVVACA